ncbi:MAG: hypothetical protein KKG14_13970 [Alphaproteobacteria bacterium]|nr:hypothetical protein [Alphaproteobacteria bacterium]MBU2269802.1 hypothetical protein [Alphaproteobacteria bacterium]MBU2419804.1 hypothetical protein [Alphaproteobacteria bacterium]
MAWFKCLIEGENFPGTLIQQDGLVGFFVIRCVEAETEEEAEAKALAALKQEPMFDLGGAAKPKDARVYFNEIVEIDEPLAQLPGATWFEMEKPKTP